MDTNTLTAAVGAAAVGAIGGYMTLIEQFNIQTKELELYFPNLPKAFDGYRILHISDLHMTKHGLLEEKTINLIKSRKVDMCVVTGDVTTSPRASDTFRRICSSINHTDPIFTVLGNSEHKPWVDTKILIDALSFEGEKLLINSSSVIQRSSESIYIVGVDDPYSHRDNLQVAFEGVDPNSFIIFLTHCPSSTPQAIEHGADLILAGHTHGGQVRFPFTNRFWTHMRKNKRLNNGLYNSEDLSRIIKSKVEHSILFVNRGIGTSRIHIRFLCPPEIVWITLKRSQ